VEKISDKKLGAIICHNRGYEIIDSKVFFNGKERKLDIRTKKGNGQSSYSSFGIKNDEGKRIQVFVHHLMAYKKFGKKFIDGLDSYGDELIVIHLDGNTLNNSYDNIFLGNRSHARRQRDGEKLESKIFEK